MQNLTNGYHTYYVYILTNKHRTTFYIGVTNNLKIRLQQHIDSVQENTHSFVSRYKTEYLVYYEKYTWIQEAIAREKQLKGWRREKKLSLIQSFNENFTFLNHQFLEK
ncbi:GIY-YIG nuclease family protein [Flavobacterium sp. HNIBRBA15423]|uniref:GIY-YIG nuclease family protein n=1 Tax=Flavobacterium sp. HNIBRBA15423 TaxID=3458683 RepID=UPI00404464BE